MMLGKVENIGPARDLLIRSICARSVPAPDAVKQISVNIATTSERRQRDIGHLGLGSWSPLYARREERVGALARVVEQRSMSSTARTRQVRRHCGASLLLACAIGGESLARALLGMRVCVAAPVAHGNGTRNIAAARAAWRQNGVAVLRREVGGSQGACVPVCAMAKCCAFMAKGV